MGFFSNILAKLGIGKDEAPAATAPTTAPTPTPTIAPMGPPTKTPMHHYCR